MKREAERVEPRAKARREMAAADLLLLMIGEGLLGRDGGESVGE